MARTVKCHICYRCGNHCGRNRKTCLFCNTARALPGCCPEICWIPPIMMCPRCLQNTFFKHTVLPEDIADKIIGYMFTSKRDSKSKKSKKKKKKLKEDVVRVDNNANGFF